MQESASMERRFGTASCRDGGRQSQWATGLLILAAVGWLGFPGSGARAAPPEATPDYQAKYEEEKLRAQDLEIRVIQLQNRVRELLRWKTVRELERQIAEIRDLPLHRPVEMQTLNPSETRALIDRLLDRELPQDHAEALQRALATLGTLDPKTDLREVLLDLYSEQVGGLYDEQTGKLYVMEQFDPDSRLGKVILAHEIGHALQDQNYNLKEWPLSLKDNSDRVYAALSVLEGDAMVLMTEYLLDNLSLAWLLELPKIMNIDQAAFNTTPPFLQYCLLFPYLEGMNLVIAADAYERNGHRRLLEHPPATTEQVIHPEKFFASTPEAPVPVALRDWGSRLGGDWTLRLQETFGEMGIRAILMPRDQPLKLRYFSTQPLALDARIEQAAAGWGGDRLGLWMQSEGNAFESNAAEDGTGAAFLEWRTAWDTERDAIEFYRYATETWLPAVIGAPQPVPARAGGEASVFQGADNHWARIERTGNRVDLLIGDGVDPQSLYPR